jgi:membrane dipeptidase
MDGHEGEPEGEMIMSRWLVGFVLRSLTLSAVATEGPSDVSEKARRIHASGLLFDGHNDPPWRLREAGDVTFTTIDIGQRLKSGQTDIPRLREGGLKAQFWSVFIPSEHPNPARTVAEQIDLVNRMVERYPDDLEMVFSADDVERIVKAGKIASLIGIEGGVAIEDDLALLRAFHRLGARYMTLTHNTSLAWADAAFDVPRSHGLSPFGKRVVREMNRLGMLVDISHVSPETMAAVLRVRRPRSSPATPAPSPSHPARGTSPTRS